ncbi:MAG: cupin domain-containing protein [Colwellia sp.]|nr:cupin domain-containing protein [Colwellia sp.]
MFSLNDRMSFDIETLVRRGSDAETSREYNADLRRLLPGPGYGNTKRALTEFGAILVTVRPQEEVDAHHHDEEECFIVVSGQGDLQVEDQTTTLHPGDVVYMPRFWMHQLRNPNDTAFTFVDLYWDDKGRSFDQYVQSQRAEAL